MHCIVQYIALLHGTSVNLKTIRPLCSWSRTFSPEIPSSAGNSGILREALFCVFNQVQDICWFHFCAIFLYFPFFDCSIAPGLLGMLRCCWVLRLRQTEKKNPNGRLTRSPRCLFAVGHCVKSTIS